MTNNAYGAQALSQEPTVPAVPTPAAPEVSQPSVDGITVPATGAPLVVPEIAVSPPLQPLAREAAPTPKVDGVVSSNTIPMPGMAPPLPQQQESAAAPSLPMLPVPEIAPNPELPQQPQPVLHEAPVATPLAAPIPSVQPDLTVPTTRIDTLAQEPGQPLTAPAPTEIPQLPQSTEQLVSPAEQILTQKRVPAPATTFQPEAAVVPAAPATAQSRPLTASTSPIFVIRKIEEFFIRDVKPDKLAQRLEATVGHHIN